MAGHGVEIAGGKHCSRAAYFRSGAGLTYFGGYGLRYLKYILRSTNIATWKKKECLMGKSIISMAMFNSYVSLPGGSLACLRQVNILLPVDGTMLYL